MLVPIIMFIGICCEAPFPYDQRVLIFYVTMNLILPNGLPQIEAFLTAALLATTLARRRECELASSHQEEEINRMNIDIDEMIATIEHYTNKRRLQQALLEFVSAVTSLREKE
jgi:hypothetical protein